VSERNASCETSLGTDIEKQIIQQPYIVFPKHPLLPEYVRRFND